MKQVRYDQPVLRDLSAGGFDENRQGVMMSGRTWDREVQVVVYLNAIKLTFPKVASVMQCISFVKRNLDPFRGLVNGKLFAGNTAKVDTDSDWRGAALLVEITGTDLARSRRWLSP